MIATQITGFGTNGTASDAKYLILAVQVGRTIVGWLCLRVPTTAPASAPLQQPRGEPGGGAFAVAFVVRFVR